jgi:protocatechuate 3,4-dioxygenase beta subunit
MDADRRSVLVAACTLSVSGSLRALAAPREQILGPCQGCEWVYEGMPSRLASRARIARPDEPGAPMTLEGVVTTARGVPAPNVIVYAYHTNQAGLYPPAANGHGSLKGWALTDPRGQYRFDTIRPGAYPSRDIAEHVHIHVIEPGIATYYIENLEFLDDRLLDTTGAPPEPRGGPGRALPLQRDGVWQVRRDIVLGRNIDGYPR